MPTAGRRLMGLLLAVLTAATPGCANTSSTAGSALQPGTDGFVDWLVEHRDDVGIVVLVNGEERLAHQPDERFALASVIKVLILITYAEQVADGRLQEQDAVPVQDVARFYLAGTDGGAHDAARAEWGETDEVSLDQVARAMLRHSSNAATDALLEKVGGPPAVLAVARRLGMRMQDPPAVIHDLFSSWEDGGDVRDLAAKSPSGTAREWAGLMERARTGEGLSPSAAAIGRKHLEWPMELGSNSRTFDAFGTKGGALPGILTEASYVVSRGGSAVSVALLLRDLPEDAEADLRKSYVHQQLIGALAQDPSILAELSQRLQA